MLLVVPSTRSYNLGFHRDEQKQLNHQMTRNHSFLYRGGVDNHPAARRRCVDALHVHVVAHLPGCLHAAQHLLRLVVPPDAREPEVPHDSEQRQR